MSALPRLAEYLRAKLAEIGMSQAEFSRRSTLSDSYVSQLLKGERKGREVDTQKRIAQGLGISHKRLVAEVQGLAAPQEQQSTIAAISNDPDLTEGQKRIMLDTYQELRRRRR